MPITTWPTRDEYDIAMKSWANTVYDEDIRRSTLAQDKLGIQRYGGANLYTCLYRFGDWMVRCFCSKLPAPTRSSQTIEKPPDDIEERYKAISAFCYQNMGSVSALLPVTYVERGVLVETNFPYPIVKMPFLRLPQLGKFIADNYTNDEVMQRLCKSWLCMINELEAASMAHGDLDLTNIFVDHYNPNLTLKLIDYDNVWIPALVGHPQTEKGHKSFQHPAFIQSKHRPFDASMDRFSALVMYISLKVLALRPDLYRGWGADDTDRLLLSANDYDMERNVSSSQQPQVTNLVNNRIAQIRNLGIVELIPYVDELRESLYNDSMPRSLSEIPHRPASRVVEVVGPSRSAWEQIKFTPGIIPTKVPYLSPTVPQSADSYNQGGSAASSGSLPPTQPVHYEAAYYKATLPMDFEEIADTLPPLVHVQTQKRGITITLRQLFIFLFLLTLVIVVLLLWLSGFFNHLFHADVIPRFVSLKTLLMLSIAPLQLLNT